MVPPLRPAVPADVPAMVALSAQKRLACAEVQPLFWRPAPDADARQSAWFGHLLGRPHVIAHVADGPSGVVGFAIGTVHPAPPVYDPGGPTCTVDDFCVGSDALWATFGPALLSSVAAAARSQGAVQVVVVCAVHDAAKLAAVRAAGLSAASTWFTGPVGAQPPPVHATSLAPASYVEHAAAQFLTIRRRAERALAQVEDPALHAQIDPASNSLAVLMKHVAGNLRSRWTDFLTSDGEKPWRHRDQEFVAGAQDTRASLVRAWDEGWAVLLDALRTLTVGDLERRVTIRGESLSVFEAIERQKEHYAYHVGQIVFLAKHLAGAHWTTLSIPRGASEAHRLVRP